MEQTPSNQPLTEAELQLERSLYVHEHNKPSFSAIVADFQQAREGLAVALGEGIQHNGYLQDTIASRINDSIEQSAISYAAVVTAYDDEARYEIGARLLNESLNKLTNVARSNGVDLAIPAIDTAELIVALTVTMEAVEPSQVPDKLAYLYGESLFALSAQLLSLED